MFVEEFIALIDNIRYVLPMYYQKYGIIAWCCYIAFIEFATVNTKKYSPFEKQCILEELEETKKLQMTNIHFS